MWMRIKGFAYFVKDVMETTALRDSTLVVDAQSYFYNSYQKSELPWQYGIEGPDFANYLRAHLQRFQEANIRCYFVFKGGYENILDKLKRDHLWNLELAAGIHDECGQVLFAKETLMQVLDEMNFPYVITPNESKADCVALAQTLNCPILSFDIKFCFSGVPYISWRDFEYDNKMRAFNCGLFRLANLMQKYKVDGDRLAKFIVLTDSYIFPENHFIEFYKSIQLDEMRCAVIRTRETLKWLARVSNREAQAHIFRYINNEDDRITFLESEEKMKGLIDRHERGGMATQYLLDPASISIETNDPEWFSKGVTLNYVPTPYRNLFQWRYMTGSWCVEDMTREDSLLPAVDIIKYALDLMTNFQNEGFTFAVRNREGEQEERRILSTAVPRPARLSDRGAVSAFQDGWERARELRLFEHLADWALGAGCWERVEQQLGVSTALLALALAWLARARGRRATAALAYGALLSQACPGLQLEQPDWSRAAAHPLLEVQHCLHQLGCVWQLCGGTLARVTWRAGLAAACVGALQGARRPRAAATALAADAPAPHARRFHDLADAYDVLVQGLPGNMLPFVSPDDNGLIERVSRHDLPVMEDLQTEGLTLRVCAQVRLDAERVDRGLLPSTE